MSACNRKTVNYKSSHNQLELAKDFLRNGEKEAAEQAAKTSLRHDPENVDALNVLGLIDFFRGLDNYRLLELEDCLTGVDAEGLRDELDSHLEAAMTHFERATVISPEYGEGWANQGAVAIRLNEYNAAIAFFIRALGFPNRLHDAALTRANLGWAYFLKADMPKAAKELRQANQFNPGMCIANYRLGRVYFEREEWNKALEQFQAVAENDACPIQEAHLYLMKTYGALGMSEERQQAVASCLPLAPKSCVAARCQMGYLSGDQISVSDSKDAK